MLIGYGNLAPIPVVDGATAINLAALVDGHPARVARILGGAGSVRLRLNWSAPAEIRIVAVLGLTCPAGTSTVLTGKRAGDGVYALALGGNTAMQEVTLLPDGSRAAWFVLDEGVGPLVGLQLEVEAAAFDVGEIVVLQGVELGHQTEWSVERVDPSLRERTLGSSVNVVTRRTYRKLQMTFTPLALAEMRGQGLANGMDLDALGCAVTGGARVAAIPRWSLQGGAIDVTELHRTAIYGQATPGQASHLGGNYYSSGWAFEEIPPL